MCVCVCVCVCVYLKKEFYVKSEEDWPYSNQPGFLDFRMSHSLSFADMHDDFPRAGYEI